MRMSMYRRHPDPSPRHRSYIGESSVAEVTSVDVIVGVSLVLATSIEKLCRSNSPAASSARTVTGLAPTSPLSGAHWISPRRGNDRHACRGRIEGERQGVADVTDRSPQTS